MQYQVAVVDGTHRCFATETGIDRRYVGCRHLLPRSAVQHADRLASSAAADVPASAGTHRARGASPGAAGSV